MAANGGCLERERIALAAEVDPRAPSEGSIADDAAAALEEAEERDWEESVQPSLFSSLSPAALHMHARTINFSAVFIFMMLHVLIQISEMGVVR